MYLVLAIIVTAVLSLAAGYSVEQAYGQTNMTDMTGENMTGTNTTTSSNMTGTEDDNATKGSVSGGLAVSDEGASGPKKPVKK
jgi:hypothetical protein